MKNNKPKTHTQVFVGNLGVKWTRLSRKQCKCAAAFETVQGCFR